MHLPRKKWIYLALQEAAARCTTEKTFFVRVMHVRRHLQYLDRTAALISKSQGKQARSIAVGPPGVS